MGQLQGGLTEGKALIKRTMRRKIWMATPVTAMGIFNKLLMTEINHLELKMIEEEEIRESLAF